MLQISAVFFFREFESFLSLLLDFFLSFVNTSVNPLPRLSPSAKVSIILSTLFKKPWVRSHTALLTPPLLKKLLVFKNIE
ncbi:hypothetical protein [Spiroplasma endosymbiont of Atherix ibis]|uniref:hypothetical protein n=1 Tax=Spiroplasma endosymbiont of Atherix ibis TaxID=3066291 RepID=UPI0030CF5A67